MSTDPTLQCPSPDTLAALVEGNLGHEERAIVLAHAETCRECMASILSANEFHQTEHVGRAPRRRLRRWAIAAAVAAAAVLLVAVPLLRRRNEPMARLVALAPRAARHVESRLAGGFPWTPYGGAERSADGAPDAGHLKLAGAAGEIIERADRERSPEAQHAAGVALVLTRSPAAAILRLESATAGGAANAQALSDLAAARYEAASQLGRASLYPTALAAADAALRIEPAMPEALFNRALILQRLGLTDEAGQAWRRYLEVDPSSDWAMEARARLADLPASTRSSEFHRVRPLLETAAERGDADAVRRYVNLHRDRARAHVETEILGRWGEAMQRHDVADAERWLGMARRIAAALTALSGESLARDAVRAIDGAPPHEREAIGAAHVSYRRGRLAYSRHELEAAQRDLLAAAGMFDRVRDPMALAARYYAASVRLARNETSEACAELERSRLEADTHPAFVSLGAHVRWELGRAHMIDEDWPGALAVLEEGAAMFHRAGDRASEAFVETMLSRALTFAGRTDDAWLARTRAFAALSAEGEPALLAAGVAAAMQVELTAGRREAGLPLADLQLAIARRSAEPGLVVEALATRATLLSTIDAKEALGTARQAEDIARATPDAAQRDRLTADADVAIGASLLAADPLRATESLDRAVTFFAGHDLAYAMPEPLLLRARAATRLGDAASAMRDLEQAIRIVERRRDGEGVAAMANVLDAEHALFTDAIRISLQRGDTAGAFAFAERANLASITLPQLQRRLAGSDTAVLEIVALPEELVTFAVSEQGVAVGRQRRDAGTLTALGEASLTERGTTAASALYDDVIRPTAAALAGIRHLVIVPDPCLAGAPLGALYDARAHQYLVEQFAVSVAPSASSLRNVALPAALSLVAIQLPAEGLNDALPEAEREIGEITGQYRDGRAIGMTSATLDALRGAAASADVLHISGHTASLPGGGDQALLLRSDSLAGVEPVSSRRILGASPIHAGIVVLAACQTLRPPASAATHARSLGAAFVAAGATDVVGTLAPIGDRDARLLFCALHRRLAKGEAPADALRAVQCDAITGDPNGRRAWRAVALLSTRIPGAVGTRRTCHGFQSDGDLSRNLYALPRFRSGRPAPRRAAECSSDAVRPHDDPA